jgi:hypothetical protein
MSVYGADRRLRSGSGMTKFNLMNKNVTEPSAVAPDAKVNFSVEPYCLRLSPKLSLASGATALGSVMAAAHCQDCYVAFFNFLNFLATKSLRSGLR